MENRRLLLAALLSMAVLFLWQVIFPPPEPPAPPVETAAAPAAPPAAPAAVGPAGPAAPAGTPAAAATPSPLAEELAAAPPVAAAAEQRVVLENAELRVEFTNRGAQLVSLIIKGKTAEQGEPLELVQQRPAPPYPFALLDAAGAPRATEAAFYAVEQHHGPTGEEVVFRYRGEAGGAEKRFSLRPDGRLDFTLAVTGAEPLAVLLGPGLRERSRDELDSRYTRRAAVWAAAGEVEVLDARGADEPVTLTAGGLEWLGFDDAYFLSVVIPERGLAAARFEPVLLVPGAEASGFAAQPLPAGRELTAQEKQFARDLRAVLVASGPELVGSSYWGPKQYDRLAATPWGLERTVHWGWQGFLAKPLLRGLQWIHAHVVANYGWSIVVLTSVLKILLLPLSIAAFRSMRKMQKLNPRMQAVREKWRGKLRDKQGKFNPDAQRQMNEEIMALYRQEGVNPAGGCLPILVQLPIFFAFYTLLSTAVELWRAPWMGWIQDLTAPDPYYILPIVMGISQIVQQKMTPPPPDPVQRRMIQAMPIVFTIFSLGFASGLVLYWFTNNLWSIVQQMVYNSFKDHHPDGGPEPARAARGKGKRP